MIIGPISDTQYRQEELKIQTQNIVSQIQHDDQKYKEASDELKKSIEGDNS